MNEQKKTPEQRLAAALSRVFPYNTKEANAGLADDMALADPTIAADMELGARVRQGKFYGTVVLNDGVHRGRYTNRLTEGSGE